MNVVKVTLVSTPLASHHGVAPQQVYLYRDDSTSHLINQRVDVSIENWHDQCVDKLFSHLFTSPEMKVTSLF